jgi:23S rRNA (adenine1618-N6)-methyltransferase
MLFLKNIHSCLKQKKMTPKTITETNLHPRNQHRFRYDFELLIKNSPELKSHVSINEHSIETIDFSDPEAVKSLNQALLISYYDIQNGIFTLSLPSYSW